MSAIRHILHLSDTHGAHRQLAALPDADVVVHSGDVGMAGTEVEVMDFFDWFLGLPYRYKIFVPGNHDNCLLGAQIEGLDANCYMLCHSGVELEGMKFYGVPMFMEDVLSGEQERMYAAIPADTDILVTHQPPYGLLDVAGSIHFGSRALLARVGKVAPRYHLFGHIHDVYGQTYSDSTCFVNSSLVDEYYRLTRAPQLLSL